MILPQDKFIIIMDFVSFAHLRQKYNKDECHFLIWEKNLWQFYIKNTSHIEYTYVILPRSSFKAIKY